MDPRINAELAEAFVEKTIQHILAPILAPLSLIEDTESDLIRDLRVDNQKSFQDIREEMPLGYSVEDNLLLYHGRLCVRRNTPLCTRLIREAHDQVSSAHPSGLKTYQLLAPKYHWNGMSTDCKRYVDNCGTCRRFHSN